MIDTCTCTYTIYLFYAIVLHNIFFIFAVPLYVQWCRMEPISTSTVEVMVGLRSFMQLWLVNFVQQGNLVDCPESATTELLVDLNLVVSVWYRHTYICVSEILVDF